MQVCFNKFLLKNYYFKNIFFVFSIRFLNMFTNFCILELYTVQTKCKIVQFGIKKSLYSNKTMSLCLHLGRLCLGLLIKDSVRKKNNVKKVLRPEQIKNLSNSRNKRLLEVIYRRSGSFVGM